MCVCVCVYIANLCLFICKRDPEIWLLIKSLNMLKFRMSVNSPIRNLVILSESVFTMSVMFF